MPATCSRQPYWRADQWWPQPTSDESPPQQVRANVGSTTRSPAEIENHRETWSWRGSRQSGWRRSWTVRPTEPLGSRSASEVGILCRQLRAEIRSRCGRWRRTAAASRTRIEPPPRPASSQHEPSIGLQPAKNDENYILRKCAKKILRQGPSQNMLFDRHSYAHD